MVKSPTHTCMLGQLHVLECIKYTCYVFTVAIFRVVDQGFPGWIPKLWSPTYYLAKGRKQIQEIRKKTYEVAKSESQKLQKKEKEMGSIDGGTGCNLLY